MLDAVLRALVVLLPWPVRRRLLVRVFGYEISPAARIGFAWIFPERLVMGPGATIGHLTVCKGLSLLSLDAYASIGRGNWITAYPLGAPRHFLHQPDRRPELRIGAHAAVTNRHIVDCTASVEIGAFSTFAGFRSQILTHSIDLATSRQSSAPVRIGRYCFVGTGSVLLGGSVLPDHCVLGALSLLNKPYSTTHRLYAGVPAREISALDPGLRYFQREVGFVE